jgi:hypothetical protein
MVLIRPECWELANSDSALCQLFFHPFRVQADPQNRRIPASFVTLLELGGTTMIFQQPAYRRELADLRPDSLDPETCLCKLLIEYITDLQRTYRHVAKYTKSPQHTPR